MNHPPGRAARPFVDRPVADLERAHALACAVAQRRRWPSPRLVRAGMNASFRSGEFVIRVGTPTAPAHTSVELAETLRRRGIPVPVPVGEPVGEGLGALVATAWRWLRASGEPIDWFAVGDVVRRVHEIPPDALPSGYPIGDPRRFPWWDFDTMLGDVRDLLDADARRGLERTIERHVGWHERVSAEAVLCHGDVHPGNVVMTADGPVLLDWDLLCWANPAWDHGMLAGYARRWGGPPDAYPRFVDGYGRSFDGTAALAAVRDLRDVAAALMRVGAGRADPEAWAEADRRLEVYRGAPDPPLWRLQ